MHRFTTSCNGHHKISTKVVRAQLIALLRPRGTQRSPQATASSGGATRGHGSSMSCLHCWAFCSGQFFKHPSRPFHCRHSTNLKPLGLALGQFFIGARPSQLCTPALWVYAPKFEHMDWCAHLMSNSAVTQETHQPWRWKYADSATQSVGAGAVGQNAIRWNLFTRSLA